MALVVPKPILEPILGLAAEQKVLDATLVAHEKTNGSLRPDDLWLLVRQHLLRCLSTGTATPSSARHLS